ncbi:MAG: hypothetical protein JST07_01760 [Bacteroidetes bacterium]|nr:hypothetical protein [Bacteroidota bacterium]
MAVNSISILYRNTAERQALASLTLQIGEANKKYIDFGFTKSIDEYKVRYKFFFISLIVKCFEIFKLFRLIKKEKNIIFCTPHPAFRISRFLNPQKRLYLYLKTLHIIDEDLSFSDKISGFLKKRKMKLGILFNNYYADFYYTSGRANNDFLYRKGILNASVILVGLHPEIPQSIINASNVKRRIIIITQSWKSHGLPEIQRSEEAFIIKLIENLGPKYYDNLYLKVHPRDYTHYPLATEKIIREVSFNDTINENDIIIGGMSSLMIEAYIKKAKLIFFVVKEAEKYLSTLENENISFPYSNTVNEIGDYINKNLSGQNTNVEIEQLMKYLVSDISYLNIKNE